MFAIIQLINNNYDKIKDNKNINQYLIIHRCIDVKLMFIRLIIFGWGYYSQL